MRAILYSCAEGNGSAMRVGIPFVLASCSPFTLSCQVKSSSTCTIQSTAHAGDTGGLISLHMQVDDQLDLSVGPCKLLGKQETLHALGATMGQPSSHLLGYSRDAAKDHSIMVPCRASMWSRCTRLRPAQATWINTTRQADRCPQLCNDLREPKDCQAAGLPTTH